MSENSTKEWSKSIGSDMDIRNGEIRFTKTKLWLTK